MTVNSLLDKSKLKARKLGNRTLIDAADVRRSPKTLPTYHPKLD